MVITIVVVLLALLTPALDQAIYQAELAVCGAKLGAVGSSTIAYAAEHGRSYPYRTSAGWPQEICGPSDNDRPMFSRYLSINGHFLDPMAGEVDLSNEELDGSGRTEYTYSSYALWFGFTYDIRGVSPLKGMRKLGDKLIVGDDQVLVLAQDSDVTHTSRPDLMFTSHPDPGGVLTPWVSQHEPLPGQSGALSLFHNYSFSFWYSPSGAERGPVDNNYAYTDGSVRRIDGVAFVNGNDIAAATDMGMTILPLHRLGNQMRRIVVPVR